MLIAVGLAVGFRANVWNIGAEGQFIIGAVGGGGVALALQGQPRAALLLPTMVVAGAIGGALWAAIPALLKTKFNANEILASLMLVYIAQLGVSWLVHGPWKDPDGFNFPQTEMFDDAALLPMLIEGTRLNSAFVIALAALARGLRVHAAELHRLQDAGRGPGRGGGALCRVLGGAARSGSACWPAARWPASPAWREVSGPDGAAHRASCRTTTASRRSSSPSSGG